MTEDKGRTVSAFCHLTSVICYLTLETTVITTFVTYLWDITLCSYQDLQGVEQALNRLSKRITQGDRLLGAIEEINHHYLKLEADFLIFFPYLGYYVKNHSKR